jgi:acyl-CoA thioesterase-1
MGKDYIDAFRAIYADLAQRHDVVFYPFFLDGAALNPELMQPDGIHPNAAGIKVIVENMLPKVEELLAKVEAEGEVHAN